MTAKELKDKLAAVPDDMEVVICREDTTLGGFFLIPHVRTIVVLQTSAHRMNQQAK